MNRADVYGYMMAMILVLLGGLNHMLSLFDIPLFTNLLLKRTVFFLIGAASLYLLFNRNTYLPFLAPTAFPVPALNRDATSPVNSRTFILKNIPDGVEQVIYWAANSSVANMPFNSMEEAFARYKNSGVRSVFPAFNANDYATFKQADKKTHDNVILPLYKQELAKEIINIVTKISDTNNNATNEKVRAVIVELSQQSINMDALSGALKGLTDEFTANTPITVLKKEFDEPTDAKVVERLSSYGNFSILDVACPASFKRWTTIEPPSIFYRYGYKDSGYLSEVMQTTEPVFGCNMAYAPPNST